MNLRQLQDELKPWEQHNFGDRPSWYPLLGVVEEVGELAHAYLKRAEGIRLNENHTEKERDAVGDIVIFLADFCNAQGYDMGEIIAETWARVKQRDWKADPIAAADRPRGVAGSVHRTGTESGKRVRPD